MREETIEHSELLPGDILFIRDQDSGYFKHICVVATSQCDGIYNRVHTAGLGPTKGLIISTLFSSEQLEKVLL